MMEIDRIEEIRENLETGYYYDDVRRDKHAAEDLEFLLAEYDKVSLYLLSRVALYEVEGD